MFIIPFLLTVISCGKDDSTEPEPTIDAENPQAEFFLNLLSLCGETFSGEAAFPDEPGHELMGVELSAILEICTENEIRIPFRAGEDESRTWIITKEDDGLILKHDHRYPDGSPHEITNYGGLANNEGTSTRQFFEADQETAEMLPEASANVWMVEIEINSDQNRMIYNLERNKTPRFRAELLQQ